MKEELNNKAYIEQNETLRQTYTYTQIYIYTYTHKEIVLVQTGKYNHIEEKLMQGYLYIFRQLCLFSSTYTKDIGAHFQR